MSKNNGRDVIVQVNNNYKIDGLNRYQKEDKRYIEYRDKWEKYPQDFYVDKFPLFLDVEVTNYCNLRCPFCFTTIENKKKNIEKGYISYDFVKKILDEGYQNGLYGIKFNLRGEPLLHKEISKFVKYAKQKKMVDVYFNTNGMLLDENESCKLIEAGLDRISISFEGYTKEIYEKYRVGSIYERVINNIEKLQLLKEKLNVKYPIVRIQTVVIPELKFNLKEYSKFWEPIVDEIGFLDYKNMNNDKKIEFKWACCQPWQRMAVLWNGDILSCNQHNKYLNILGNIKNNTIKECWNSNKMKKIRDFHQKGLSHKAKSCIYCGYRNREIMKNIEKDKK